MLCFSVWASLERRARVESIEHHFARSRLVYLTPFIILMAFDGDSEFLLSTNLLQLDYAVYTPGVRKSVTIQETHQRFTSSHAG